MLGIASFPAVLRSDNAQENVGDVVASLNAMLNIHHITGSAYHPQSQGTVERLHRTLNEVMRGLVADHPEDWEERLPFVECILRMVPLKSLGGRSPFEVVTGLRPRLPAALNSAIPVGHVSISEYVGKLRDYFRESHAEIQRVQQAAVEDREEDVTGYLSKELEVGDIVLVRREATAGRKGPLRFQSRTYPQLYRVRKKSDKLTFKVESVVSSSAPVPFTQPLHALRLVKIDLPLVELEPRQLRHVEVYERDTDTWRLMRVDRFAVDGRVWLVPVGRGGRAAWVDLSRERYRWVVGIVPEG